MYEQDKFDEESQIEAVTVQDAGTEDEDVANDNNVWRIVVMATRYNNANCDTFCWIKMNPCTKILLYLYFLSRIDAMTLSMDEVVGDVGDGEVKYICMVKLLKHKTWSRSKLTICVCKLTSYCQCSGSLSSEILR